MKQKESRLVKISEFAEVVTGGTPSTRNKTYWENGHIPWIASGECKNSIIIDATKLISEQGYLNSSTKMMPIDTVVIALTGATTGKVGLLGIEACGNQSVTGILPNSKFISKYLFYYLISIRDKVINDSYGGAQKHISQKYVKEIKVPLPPLENQKKIVEVLDKAQVLIDARIEQIRLMDELIQSVFYEMFGDQQLNPFSFDKGTIRDIVTEVKYGTSKPAVGDGKYKYLRMNNITYGGELDLTSLKYIDITDKDYEKYVVRKGDILFNRTNSKELVGKTCVFNIDEEMIIAGYIIRVRLNDRALPVYLSDLMNSQYGKETLQGMCKAIVGQANINAQELQDIKIIIPPIELQQEFAQLKEQVDKLKLAVKKSLDETQVLFDSLMQEYFK